MKRWPTGSPPPSRILPLHQQQQTPGSVISRCFVPNTTIPGASTSTGTAVDAGRPGVIQHQMILSQGQVAQRMQLAEKVTSPQQSPVPNNNRVNIVTQQVQPTSNQHQNTLPPRSPRNSTTSSEQAQPHA